MLGYPGGGSFMATPARIREVIQLNGPDIYRTTTVNREVYMIRGTVRQGDSGGPLIDLNGRVLGVVFGAAVDDPETGFVLTASEVARQMAQVRQLRAGDHRSVHLRLNRSGAVDVRQESRQLLADHIRRLFVTEMSCA